MRFFHDFIESVFLVHAHILLMDVSDVAPSSCLTVFNAVFKVFVRVLGLSCHPVSLINQTIHLFSYCHLSCLQTRHTESVCFGPEENGGPIATFLCKCLGSDGPRVRS